MPVNIFNDALGKDEAAEGKGHLTKRSPIGPLKKLKIIKSKLLKTFGAAPAGFAGFTIKNTFVYNPLVTLSTLPTISIPLFGKKVLKAGALVPVALGTGTLGTGAVGAGSLGAGALGVVAVGGAGAAVADISRRQRTSA